MRLKVFIGVRLDDLYDFVEISSLDVILEHKF